MKFDIILTDAPVSKQNRDAILAKGGFGTDFTDHMVTIEWTKGQGWHNAQVIKYAPFALNPASAVLHYAQEIFEGLKAYRGKNNQIILFRPEQNAKRFNESAQRMAMPSLPENIFLKAVESLAWIERDWIAPGNASLYLRPFMFANEAFLGVRPANNFIFSIIASPAGDYFKNNNQPIKIWVSQQYSRAAVGGTGAAKCGGNYASSLIAQNQAYENGCDQVVFLDAIEHKWVEELGGMNIFFVRDNGSIFTTPLTGTILNGITRSSILELARAKGILTEECKYSLSQWREEAESGKITEVFACGTAAVIAAIGEVKCENYSFKIGDGQSGVITSTLREELSGLQRGEIKDIYGWTRIISN